MSKIICFTIITAVIFCFSGTGQAADVREHSKTYLSQDLQVVLNQEMNGIEQGMMRIIPAIAAGNWDNIINIAQKIKNSFILKQKLTKDQLKELHDSLPAEFIEMDHDFHATAGKLGHAASQQDAELVNFYYYRLHSQCIRCHSRYASERFPNLRKGSHGMGAH